MGRFKRNAVVRNATALYLSQITGLVIPLVILPILARRLTPDGLGEVVIAQAVVSGLAVLLEFGFSISATRRLAQGASAPALFSSILGARLALLFVATASFVSIASFFGGDPKLWLASYGYLVALGFSPFWFFQGRQEMTAPIVLEVSARITATALTLVMVHDSSDAWLVLAMQAMGGIVSTFVPYFWIARSMKLTRPTRSGSLTCLKDSFSTFVYKGALAMTSAGVLAAFGARASGLQMGLYGAADRLNRASLAALGPIQQSMFPEIAKLVSLSRSTARKKLLTLGPLLFVIGIGGAIAIYFLAPWVVQTLYGNAYEGSIPVLRMLGLLVPIAAINDLLGAQWMLATGREYAYTAIVLVGFATAVAVSFWGSPIAISLATAVVASQIVVSILLGWQFVRGGRDSANVVQIS